MSALPKRRPSEAASPQGSPNWQSRGPGASVWYDKLSFRATLASPALSHAAAGGAFVVERHLRSGVPMEPHARSDLDVAVVAENPETVDGLAAYLHHSGVRTKGSCAVDQLLDLASSAVAVVLFPDEFGAEEMVEAIQKLRRAQPMLLILLVTRDPQRFGAALRGDGRSVPPVVLPKPSFGWTILDALREHAIDLAGRS